MAVGRTTPSPRVGLIILAAGNSRRMGCDKLMADLGGQPVLSHVLHSAASSGLPALCVIADPASVSARLALDSGFPTVVAEDHALGMAHSIRAGIEACPADWDAALIMLGDMPLTTSELLTAIAAASAPDRIVVPIAGGQRGNPVSWGRNHFHDLVQLSGDQGGRKLLAARPEAVLPIQWPDLDEIRMDVDEPSSLARARDAFQRRARQRSEQ
jgi:molybdenum cofactor cytidylyltransferase